MVKALRAKTCARMGIISWNPNFAFTTTNEKVISAASILNHEFDHGASYDRNNVEHIRRTREKDRKYGNMEEKRAITGNEQKTSKRLGEIGWWETTRTDHTMKPGDFLFAPDPTKNQGTPTIMSSNLNEVQITSPRRRVNHRRR